jgi:hypothetical protein
MNKKIIFVADFFSNEINGGGELNNDEFISLVRQKGYEVFPIKSSSLTIDIIKNSKDCHYIFGNFLALPPSVYNCILESNIRYSIYEHDHKYLVTRDPSKYENHIAPKEHITNVQFYEKAVAIFCQSKLHKDTVQKNLKLDTIHNLSGNLWSSESLTLLRENSIKEKREIVSIWNSTNPIKNTSKAVAYCKVKSLPYELLGPLPYDNFLNAIGKNDRFLFFPETMETLCRVVVEARMMNVKTMTNGHLGATSEDWFSLKGEELINLMESKRETIPTYILETIQ